MARSHLFVAVTLLLTVAFAQINSYTTYPGSLPADEDYTSANAPLYSVDAGDSPAYGVIPLSKSQLAKLENILISFISYQESRYDCQPGDTVGALVRLGFHDCGTFDLSAPLNNRGGCHACLFIECSDNTCCEFANPDNNGLQDIIWQLKSLYANSTVDGKPLKQVISKADWLVLAANMAVYFSSKFTVKPQFYYGRIDCAQFYGFDENKPCAGDVKPRFFGRLPGATKGLDEIKRVFVASQRLNLKPIEAVALLGAHTIGRLEERFSGFGGRWMEQSDLWNNEYFTDVVNHHWYPQFNKRGNPLYRQPNFEQPENYATMLNTDISIYYNIFPYGTQDQNKRCVASQDPDVNPKLTYCQRWTGADEVYANATDLFAKNNKAWTDWFKSAWYKLTSIGAKLYNPSGKAAFCSIVNPSCGAPGTCEKQKDDSCNEETGECAVEYISQSDLHQGDVFGKCVDGIYEPDCSGPTVGCQQQFACIQKGDCRHGTCTFPFRPAGRNCTQIGFETWQANTVEFGKCDGYGVCKPFNVDLCANKNCANECRLYPFCDKILGSCRDSGNVCNGAPCNNGLGECRDGSCAACKTAGSACNNDKQCCGPSVCSKDKKCVYSAEAALTYSGLCPGNYGSYSNPGYVVNTYSVGY